MTAFPAQVSQADNVIRADVDAATSVTLHGDGRIAERRKD
jgi:hypothetical protein